jgi:hypothetical protein
VKFHDALQTCHVARHFLFSKKKKNKIVEQSFNEAEVYSETKLGTQFVCRIVLHLGAILRKTHLPFCIEQFGFHWNDFHKILHLSIFFRKSGERIEILLSSVKSSRRRLVYLCDVTGQSLLGLVRIQPGKFLSGCPRLKVQIPHPH